MLFSVIVVTMWLVDDVRIVLQSLDSVDSLPRARCLSLHVKRIALRVCDNRHYYPLLTLTVTFQRTLNTHDFSVHCSVYAHYGLEYRVYYRLRLVPTGHYRWVTDRVRLFAYWLLSNRIRDSVSNSALFSCCCVVRCLAFIGLPITE